MIMGDMMAWVIWLNIAREHIDSPTYLVHRWRGRKASEPRDMIYALMGMCPSGVMPFTEACDYDISTVEVFCNLTHDLIKSEGSLLPLIDDPRLEPEKATPGIPRWAVDASCLPDWYTDWVHVYAWPEYNAHQKRPLDLARCFDAWGTSKHLINLEGVCVDTIEVTGEPWLNPIPQAVDRTRFMRERLCDWELLARKHVKRGASGSAEPYPGGYTLREAFGRLILGDFVRDSEQWVYKYANEADVAEVYNFMESGQTYYELQRTIRSMMNNTRFFITRTGLMGIGHMETQPGEEVWVFHGGNYPFTVIPRGNENGTDYDFGGRCYVQGIMFGEAFSYGRETRVLTIH